MHAGTVITSTVATRPAGGLGVKYPIQISRSVFQQSTILAPLGVWINKLEVTRKGNCWPLLDPSLSIAELRPQTSCSRHRRGDRRGEPGTASVTPVTSTGLNLASKKGELRWAASHMRPIHATPSITMALIDREIRKPTCAIGAKCAVTALTVR
jgi:hypothetical protein